MCSKFSGYRLCDFFFFQAEDGIRDLVRSRGLGDVYKRQGIDWDKVQTVVELGPGNGTFTHELIARSKPGTHIISVSYTHLTLPTSDLV